MLHGLLTSFWARANTRFSAYATWVVPRIEDRLVLLLVICGYASRLKEGLVELLGTDWVPALLPHGDQMIAYLSKQCALMQPANLMDLNDDRFDVVFSGT